MYRFKRYFKFKFATLPHDASTKSNFKSVSVYKHPLLRLITCLQALKKYFIKWHSGKGTQSSLKLGKKAPTCVESFYVFIWFSGVKSTFTGAFRGRWFWTAFGRSDCMCRTDFCTEHRIQLRSVCMQHLWRPTVTEPRRFAHDRDLIRGQNTVWDRPARKTFLNVSEENYGYGKLFWNFVDVTNMSDEEMSLRFKLY